MKNILFTKQLFAVYGLVLIIGMSYFFTKQAEQETFHPSNAQSQTKDVKLLSLESTLIENFPDIPVYPGAAIKDSYEKVVYGKIGYEAEWSTSDNRRKVIEFYEKALPEAGWIIAFAPEDFDSYENQFIAHKNSLQLLLTVELSHSDNNQTEIVAEFPLK